MDNEIREREAATAPKPPLPVLTGARPATDRNKRRDWLRLAGALVYALFISLVTPEMVLQALGPSPPGGETPWYAFSRRAAGLIMAVVCV